MKADDAEEDPQATTNISISLKNRERLLHTVRQEIPDKRFLGNTGCGETQAQAEPAPPKFSKLISKSPAKTHSKFPPSSG